jgi:hypothetical protein
MGQQLLTICRMLLRLRQLTAHVLMLQFVIRDLLEREDIEKIREVCNALPHDEDSRKGKTIIAVRKQLDKLALDQKKKSAALEAKKAAARAANREYTKDDDDNDLLDEDPDDDADEDAELDDPNNALGGSGGQFGKEYNFKPFLRSLRHGENWERAKKKARCGYCGKQPRRPRLTSCGHLICDSPCYEKLVCDAAAEEGGNPNPACKSCGVTPTFFHPCEADEFEALVPVAERTRSKAEKKKNKERKRLDREDIAEDWLNALGEEVLPSAKTIAVKSQIMNWHRENPRVKIIIYTQFLAM